MNPDTDAHNTFAVQKRPHWPVLRNILTMFTSFFYSVFFKVFCRFLWGRRISGPAGRGGTSDDHPQSQVSTRPKDNVLASLDDDAPDDSGDASENLVSVPGTEISHEGNIEIQATQARSSDAETAQVVEGYTGPGVSRASDNTKGGCDVYYLQSERSDSSSKKTITIALLCTTHNDSSIAEDTATTSPNAPSVIDKKETMERCVQFLDGSEPQCVVSKCELDVFCHERVRGDRQVGSGSSYSCCLLQYQLDWGSSEKSVKISAPSMI